MSAPSPPPDNSVQIEQMKEQDAQRQREADKVAADAQTAKLAQLRGSARTSAGGSVDSFFNSQGVDPLGFEGQIGSKLDSILSGISPDDPNPGSAFTSAGPSIFGDLTTANQNKMLSQVNQAFAPNFETQRAPFTLDDPFLESIQATQRQSADNILRNMLDRGVITQTGFGAGETDLDKQSSGVKARLNAIGTGVLGDEQNSLRQIADRARQQAQTTRLGQSFDPGTFQNEADQNFGDFIKNLGDTLNSKVGTSNLFSTSGLAGIAGAAQGAGNTAFNPGAASGVIDPNDPNAKKTPPGTTPSQSTSIF